MNNIELIFPEIFISLSIMFLLILGVFKKDSSKIIHNISLLVLLITAVITFNETISINPTILFNDSIVIDYLSSFMKIITLIAAFIVLLISSNLQFIIFILKFSSSDCIETLFKNLSLLFNYYSIYISSFFTY